MPRLSIITVAYHSSDKLAHFLRSARLVAPDAEIIVVDNASTDDTASVAHNFGADQVVVSSMNVGFGRACNLGAHRAAGGWILFANPDLSIESIPDLAVLSHDRFGIAGGLLSERGIVDRPSLRAEPTFIEEAVAQLLYRLIPRRLSRFARQRRHPARWASGALLLCRTSEFLALGGFDRRYFLYFEDRDLASRYRRANLPIRLHTQLRGSHRHGESSSNVSTWAREVWSLASWIEYRGIWHGASAARHAAWLTLRTLSTLRLLGEHVPVRPAERKATEAFDIITFLGALDRHLADAADFYPFARAALSRFPTFTTR